MLGYFAGLPCSISLLDLADSTSSESESGYHWDRPELIRSPILSMMRPTAGDIPLGSFSSSSELFSVSSSSSTSCTNMSSRARTALFWKQVVGEALWKQWNTASQGGSTDNSWGSVSVSVETRVAARTPLKIANTANITAPLDMMITSLLVFGHYAAAAPRILFISSSPVRMVGAGMWHGARVLGLPLLTLLIFSLILHSSLFAHFNLQCLST